MTAPQEYPYANTDAARMLLSAIRLAASEEGISLRELGRRLGYKQPVALSHMSTGRIPVPVERAAQIAAELRLPMANFLTAVLRQRYPSLDWNSLQAEATLGSAAAELTWSLELAAGKPLSELTESQRRVMREVAADAQPDRRWISIHEAGVVEMLRRVRPSIRSQGLPRADIEFLEDFLPSVY